MKESITSIGQLSNLKPLNIILYYSDSCGYCHMFKDHWSDVVRKIKTERLNVKPLSIESRHFHDLGSMNFFNSISGVPTLSLVGREGNFIKKFEGQRDAKNIIEWLKEHTPKLNAGKRKSTKHKKKRKHKKTKRKRKRTRKHKRHKTKKFIILE